MATQIKTETAEKDKTRVLLALWTLGRTNSAITKGKLPKSVKQNESILTELVDAGAIAIEKKRYEKITLQDAGVKLLIQALKGGFEFEAQIGAKTANALLELMQKSDASSLLGSNGNGKAKAESIGSYEEFKQAALDVYKHLDRDYNLDNLVPIYRIRREIGDRVSRPHFDEWLLEMQTKDILQLIGGEMPEITPDKAEDSVMTALGGVRYYAKQL